VLEAYTPEDQEDLWKLRKAAIPLLMSMQGDPKPYPFIEDATVPPEELAEYVGQFEEVLTDHDTSAAYFARAGSGTPHIRPILSLKRRRKASRRCTPSPRTSPTSSWNTTAPSGGEHGDGLAAPSSTRRCTARRSGARSRSSNRRSIPSGG